LAIDNDHPFIDSIKKYPTVTQPQNRRIKRNLPDGQMGNSEVEYMNLERGRIIYQGPCKINLVVQNKKTLNQEKYCLMLVRKKKTIKSLRFLGWFQMVAYISYRTFKRFG
jgi:bisphosphoglycerate-independent phosphoglycerate mutase (AlkP superfamily)